MHNFNHTCLRAQSFQGCILACFVTAVAKEIDGREKALDLVRACNPTLPSHPQPQINRYGTWKEDQSIVLWDTGDNEEK